MITKINVNEYSSESSPVINLTSSTHRVQINKSPFIHMHYKHHTVKLTLDSGAETNMIKESVAKYINAPMKRSSQTAIQADGTSPLSIKGETCIELSRNGKTFQFEALVVADIDVDILAGVPFMHMNDVTVRPGKFQVLFADGSSYQYHHNTNETKGPHPVRFTKSHVLRAPSTTTVIWPGEYLEPDLPKEFPYDASVAIKPRTDPKAYENNCWSPPECVAAIAR